MIAPIALAVLGAWSYAGFLDEPKPPSPAPAALVSRLDPVEPKPPQAPAPKVVAAPPVVTAPPSPPARFRLVDAWGQTWEHADSAYLQSFIEARNRSTGSPPSTNRTPTPPACPNGRCP